MLVKTWRALDLKVWSRNVPHFHPRELACRCNRRYCDGEIWIDPAFLEALVRLRTSWAQPITINSGHRCRLWNAHVGGAPASRHKYMAVDVRAPRAYSQRKELYEAAREAGFTGFGFYSNWLHIDTYRARSWEPRGHKGARISWTK